MKRVTTNYSNKRVATKFNHTPVLLTEVGHPRLLEFIGKVRGLDIVDIGCGPGLISNELAKRGGRCVGIDSSPEFIAQASRDYPTIRFFLGKGSRISRAKAASFDLAVLSMVLVNVNTRKEFNGIFQEAARVLRPQGELIIMAVHPLVIRNLRDTIRAVKLPNKKGYLSRDLVFTNRTLLGDGTFIHFKNRHWSLTEISQQLARNSFVITEIREPEPKSKRHQKLFRDLISTPHYILIRARKEDR